MCIARGPSARPVPAAPTTRPRWRRAPFLVAALAIALACAQLAPPAGAADSDRPGPPPSLSGTPKQATILLEWTPPAWGGTTNITGYVIMRSPTPGNFTLLVRIGDVLSYQDLTTEWGHTYYYIVMAYNDAGEGEASAILEIKVPDKDAPRLPGAGAALAVGAIALACSALGPASRRRGP